MNYQDINKETINRWVKEGWQWAQPISHEEYVAAKQGHWDIVLTPLKHVPKEWFGDLKGKKVLGLASGGGQQMPILTAAGAVCTVMDYSDKQLETERMVAKREGYDIEIIEADMTKRFPIEDETFDLIVHPVSNCYVQDVEHVFRESYRVLKKGGVMLSGLGNEINYIVDNDEREIVWKMPFNPLKDEKAMAFMQEEQCGVQFSHDISEQIGGQLRAGFRLVDLYEDTNGEGRLHDLNIKTYIATKSVKE